MSYNDDNSSDDTSDQGWSELINFPQPSHEQQNEWDAIEKILYLEDQSAMTLKPALYNECHLWRSSFPHLRVIGHRIPDPYSEKKQKLKQQILTSVVDGIVDKMNKSLKISPNEISTKAKSESYFERGKMVEKADRSPNLASEKKTGSTPEASRLPEKTLPRGILKNSADRKVTRSRDRRRKIDSITSKKRSPLPSINVRGNKWLSRSEHCTCGKYPKSNYLNNKESKLVLPLLSNNEKKYL